MALNTSGSATSPSIYSIAGSPSSENLSVTMPTPNAKSDSSSRKSSTWKSPSNCTIPHAAGNARIRQIPAIKSGLLPVPDLIATFCNRSLLMNMWFALGVVFFPRFSSHSSNETLTSGAHKPVSKNAANTPKAASTPNDLNAATSLKRFAENAAIVVSDVSMIARPTRLTVIVPASVAFLPRFLSSLYRCKACRESSIPNAKTRIGSKFENCEREIRSIPSHENREAACPINPCIQSKAPPSATVTIATSDHRLKDKYSNKMMTAPMAKINPPEFCNSLLTSTFTACPTRRVRELLSLLLRCPSRSIMDHSIEHGDSSSRQYSEV